MVSITEHADDSPTGKLMEAIIESVDEFYSENLAQEVVRGMREAASRGFFLGSNAPFGYRKVKVSDGGKERPTLEVDPATAPVVEEIFEKSLRGSGLKELCKELNDRGVTNRGKRWYKGALHLRGFEPTYHTIRRKLASSARSANEKLRPSPLATSLPQAGCRGRSPRRGYRGSPPVSKNVGG